jgi:predicted component of type VI protein secretion system
MVGGDVFIEDLNSTNGTYINGKAVKKQLLTHNDTVEIGKYKIKYLVDESNEYEKTMIMRPSGAAALQGSSLAAQSAAHGGAPSGLAAAEAAMQSASIKVLNGAAAGREVSLTKVVTTVGKPGVQVASITRRPGGFAFSHVEGTSRPSINGVPLAGDSAPLRNGDVIELAGTQMQFIFR